MTRRIVILLFLAAFAAAMPLHGALASEAELAQAKAQGLVGERPDGFVGTVTADAPQTIRDLVSQVNRERKAQYQETATKNGIPVDQVQLVAGQKLIERTPAGQYIMNAAGKWIKKR